MVFARLLFLILISGYGVAGVAKINVVTSIPDLRIIVQEVGKELVAAESIGKGTQDPHYLEAKPSFMVKAHRADLFVAVGLDLEVGWLPNILRGARNPKIAPTQLGFLEVGPLVNPIEIPTEKITRASGDVHPLGNPHVWLDPVRAGEIAGIISKRLGEIDPDHAGQYDRNAKAFRDRLTRKLKQWQTRVEKSGVASVVTYHRTLSYFLDRFNIRNPAILEPKPGIPPTSRHILQVIDLIKEQNISLVLIENFFDPTVTKKIKQSVPTLRTATVAVSVEGAKGIDSLDDLYEHLVKAIEGKD